MAAIGDIHIIFDFEPIVKITCLAITCKNNLYPETLHCNLKHISIGQEARCEDFEAREDSEAQRAT